MIKQHEKVTFVPGNQSDNYAAFLLFEETLADLVNRLGFAGATSWGDADKIAAMWQKRRPLYDHPHRYGRTVLVGQARRANRWLLPLNYARRRTGTHGAFCETGHPVQRAGA